MQLNAAEAARRLVASLEEALNVFEIQNGQIEAAKRRSEASSTALQQMLAAGLAGKSADPAVREQFLAQQRARVAQWSEDDVRENIRASTRLSLRWEAAFCDMFEALMHLHAFPEWGEAADRLAAQVRKIRLLQVGEVDDEILDAPPFTTEAIDPPSGSGQPGTETLASSLGAGSFNKFEYVQQFMAKMEVRHQKIQEGFSSKIELTGSYLNSALEDARKLAEAVGGP